MSSQFPTSLTETLGSQNLDGAREEDGLELCRMASSMPYLFTVSNDSYMLSRSSVQCSLQKNKIQEFSTKSTEFYTKIENDVASKFMIELNLKLSFKLFFTNPMSSSSTELDGPRFGFGLFGLESRSIRITLPRAKFLIFRSKFWIFITILMVLVRLFTQSENFVDNVCVNILLGIAFQVLIESTLIPAPR